MEETNTSTAPQAASTEGTGVMAVYSKGWDILKKTFWPLLGATLIVGIISAPANYGSNNYEEMSTGYNIFTTIWSIFIATPLSVGVLVLFIKAVRGQEFKFGDMFSIFKKGYLDSIVVSVLVGLIVFGGFLLLIIPGIYFALRLTFASYLVADKRMGAIDAIKESWAMTDGYALTILGVGLLAIPIIVGGLLLLFVGIFPAVIWVQLAIAVLYVRLNNRMQKKLA